MTFVEQIWLDARFAGNDVTEYYRRPDEREAEWTELDSATLDQVVTNFEHACETSDELARATTSANWYDDRAVTVNRSTFAGSTST